MGVLGSIGKGLAKEVISTEVDRIPGADIFKKPSKTTRAKNFVSHQKEKSQLGQGLLNGEGSVDRNKFQIKKAAEDFEKQAGPMLDAYKTGLAATAATASLTAMAIGAGKLYSKFETESVWKELSKRRPDLTRTQKDREVFEALQRFSPDIVANITTATSTMERLKNTGMMPHEFVKDLSQVQKTIDSGSAMSRMQDVAQSSRFDFSNDNKERLNLEKLKFEYSKKSDKAEQKYREQQDRARNSYQATMDSIKNDFAKKNLELSEKRERRETHRYKRELRRNP